MAEPSEGTPFLADNEHSHDDPESDYVKPLPANSHFKKPIRILAAIISLLSLGIGALLIVCCVVVQVGPFEYTWGTGEAARDLAICAFVTFLLTTPTIFFPAPILINISIHIAMLAVMLVFSAEIFNNGWPDSNFCRRWSRTPYPGRPETLPERWECVRARDNLRIMLGVSAGVGILIGLLILTLLTLRVAALFRTRFWEVRRRQKLPSLSGWNPTGFTIQFTLKVLPHERQAPAAAPVPAVVPTAHGGKATDPGPSSSAQEGRLIETDE